MPANPFVFPKLNLDNIDRYAIRKSIFDALNSNLGFFRGNLLDVGCGKMPYKSFLVKNSSISNYTGVDLESAKIYDANVQPDVFWDGKSCLLQTNLFKPSCSQKSWNIAPSRNLCSTKFSGCFPKTPICLLLSRSCGHCTKCRTMPTDIRRSHCRGS